MLHIIISDGVTISKAADRMVSSSVEHLIRHGVYYFGSYDRCLERQNNVKKMLTLTDHALWLFISNWLQIRKQKNMKKKKKKLYTV